MKETKHMLSRGESMGTDRQINWAKFVWNSPRLPPRPSPSSLSPPSPPLPSRWVQLASHFVISTR